ncbi:hypothetical protein GPECTOR_18g109 [Gonium pectorale]|uniref:Uncharacterized protein n=1 Tax=Gonium pectorale TaxID=33097 RepID=A0A150GJI1_GONPE|nr:hypothetical protein GPECTOR_18g109 [Gonium pectorale]|eukprot:KXZ49951.1 hypothetical protein GPECTOR_18g109 [Gonium pectorale]
MPFLEPGLRRALLGGDLRGGEVVLYRGMLHPDVPGLAFVGLEASCSSPLLLLELQAQWLAAHLAARAQLPDPMAMREDIHRQRSWRAAALASHLASTHGSLARAAEAAYMRQLLGDLESSQSASATNTTSCPGAAVTDYPHLRPDLRADLRPDLPPDLRPDPRPDLHPGRHTAGGAGFDGCNTWGARSCGGSSTSTWQRELYLATRLRRMSEVSGLSLSTLIDIVAEDGGQPAAPARAKRTSAPPSRTFHTSPPPPPPQQQRPGAVMAATATAATAPRASAPSPLQPVQPAPSSQPAPATSAPLPATQALPVLAQEGSEPTEPHRMVAPDEDEGAAWERRRAAGAAELKASPLRGSLGFGGGKPDWAPEADVATGEILVDYLSTQECVIRPPSSCPFTHIVAATGAGVPGNAGMLEAAPREARWGCKDEANSAAVAFAAAVEMPRCVAKGPLR